MSLQYANKARMFGHSDSDSGLWLNQNAKRPSELRNLACCKLGLFLFRCLVFLNKKKKNKNKNNKQHQASLSYVKIYFLLLIR
jgi:hypothetical protein